jgi:hypothetical protein
LSLVFREFLSQAKADPSPFALMRKMRANLLGMTIYFLRGKGTAGGPSLALAIGTPEMNGATVFKKIFGRSPRFL